MASGNTAERGQQIADPASGNTVVAAGPSSEVAALSVEATAALARYQRALGTAPLSAGSRAKYTARVRGYLLWLDTSAPDVIDGDPLEEPAARDGAVRDWRTWAKTVARHRPTTINTCLLYTSPSPRDS